MLSEYYIEKVGNYIINGTCTFEVTIKLHTFFFNFQELQVAVCHWGEFYPHMLLCPTCVSALLGKVPFYLS